MKSHRYKRVLVTGASGFIGGHLCEALHRQGYTVRAAYRRNVIPPFLQKLASDGVELVQCDLLNTGCLKKLARGKKTNRYCWRLRIVRDIIITYDYLVRQMRSLSTGHRCEINPIGAFGKKH